MAKRRRYQLTEAQLKPVIRYISENYPAGVTDANIDSLSGADRDDYSSILDARYDPKLNYLVLDVETEQGQTLTKKVDVASDTVIDKVEEELPKVGYDLAAEPEWEIQSAFIKKPNLILTITPNGGGQQYQLPINLEYVMMWLPEIDSDEQYPTFEPDPDEYGDRERENRV